MLTAEEIPDAALAGARFVHFGSVSLTTDPARSATLDAVRRAKALGAVITYDPITAPVSGPAGKRPLTR